VLTNHILTGALELWKKKCRHQFSPSVWRPQKTNFFLKMMHKVTAWWFGEFKVGIDLLRARANHDRKSPYKQE